MYTEREYKTDIFPFPIRSLLGNRNMTRISSFVLLFTLDPYYTYQIVARVRAMATLVRLGARVEAHVSLQMRSDERAISKVSKAGKFIVVSGPMITSDAICVRDITGGSHWPWLRVYQVRNA